MPLPSGWNRVSRSRACPICEKPNWCMVNDDNDSVVCARVESEVPFGNSGAGWVHRLNGGVAGMSPQRTVQPAKPAAGPPPDFTDLHQRCRKSLTPKLFDALSEDLNITRGALSSIQVGWHSDLLVYTFPMKDVSGRVIGMRLRARNGRKWAISGSRNGLFVPFTLPQTGKDGRVSRIYVVEGPTDLAILIEIGLWGVGRPDNQSGRDMIVSLINKINPRDVVIIHDTDAPGSPAEELTKRGAQSLSEVLRVQGRRVYIIQPIREKDLRDWVNNRGITKETIESIVSSRAMARGV